MNSSTELNGPLNFPCSTSRSPCRNPAGSFFNFFAVLFPCTSLSNSCFVLPVCILPFPARKPRIAFRVSLFGIRVPLPRFADNTLRHAVASFLSVSYSRFEMVTTFMRKYYIIIHVFSLLTQPASQRGVHDARQLVGERA